jgi:hypothetical protein
LKRKVIEIGGSSTAKIAHNPNTGNLQILKEKINYDKKSPE